MEIVKIYNPGNTVEYQKYSNKDEVLVISTFANSKFSPTDDVVELICYGQNNELVDYVVDLRTYKPLPDSVDPVDGSLIKLQLDPKFDANNVGITRGAANLQYNFLKPLFNSSFTSYYWIKQISPSRKEIKLSSQYISNEIIRAGFSDFQAYVTGKSYYVDFYLNFGQNRLVIANNAAIVEEGEETHLLIKLYEPLPIELDVKDTLWICDKVSDSVIFNINIDVTSEPVIDENTLRGPNTRLKLDDKKGQTTPYYNYNSLFSSNVTSSIQQLRSYYEDKAIEINVDYSNFSNFIHFSSATERVNNFVYKLELIENYQQEIQDSQNFASMGSSTISIVSQSNSLTQQKIDNIIDKFDLYEYHLYFSSESFAWPKSTNTQPYLLYSVTSSQAIDWLGDKYTFPTNTEISILYSASLYDDTNPNRLANAIPQYLLDDPNNEPYLAFIDMVGQHFDNVWLYYKDISNRYSSFNNPNLGLSKDMVADALTSFGFNLYTNTSVSDNLYYTLFGINPDGSLLPPTGSEKITNYVTSSIDTLSPKELDSEIYKRLYHNLSYLLKTKGTQRGVKALICSYGIPESILTINEFGGNSRYTGSGIYEINDQKINYFTQSVELSNPVLSPYVTIQQYNTDYRLNTLEIEAAFSPADQINRNFVSSSGFVNMDQLIGNPEHQYLQYYPDLKTVSDNYFASYNYPHSIWEYIRIIKYYNNSLFKTIKDWVPAKSSTSTGIVVKSHILERNKYARTEPNMSFDNNISESIDMISIAGSDPGAVQGSVEYSEKIITPLGEADCGCARGKAKFTGELSGSFIQTTTGQAFDQSDYSTTPSGSVEVDYSANYQNLFINTRSKRFFELDYGYNQNTPTNFGIITQSISNSIDNNFNTYNDPYAPYADIQDYNYSTRAFTDSRYYGSRLSGLKYNTYTAPKTQKYQEFTLGINATRVSGGTLVPWSSLSTAPKSIQNNTLIGASDILSVSVGGVNATITGFDNLTGTVYVASGTPNTGDITILYKIEIQEFYEGDQSYGLSSVINRNSYKVGWVKSFQSQSLNFFEKTSITLKYLVDENKNLIELNKRNENLFEVQNTFKSGDNIVVSVSDVLFPSFQKPLDGTKKIFKGGFSYDPIIYRENSQIINIRTNIPLGTTVFGTGFKANASHWYFFQNYQPFGFNNGNNQNWMDKNPLTTLPAQNATGVSGYIWSEDGKGVDNNQPLQNQPLAKKITYDQWQGRKVPSGQTYSQLSWLSLESISGFAKAYDWNNKKQADAGAYAINLTKFLNFDDPLNTYFKQVVSQNESLGEDSDTWHYKVTETADYNIDCRFSVGIASRHWVEEATAVNFFPRNECRCGEQNCGLWCWEPKSCTDNVYQVGCGGSTCGRIVNNIGSPYMCTGESHKLVAILEKTKTPDNSDSWTYLASSRFKPTPTHQYKYIINSYENLLRLNGGQQDWSSAVLNFKLCSDAIQAFLTDASWESNELKIRLNAGEYVRLMLYFVDCSMFAKYGGSLKLEVTPNRGHVTKMNITPALPTTVYNNISNPYLEILNKTGAITIFENNYKIEDQILFTKNQDGSSLIFNESCSLLFTENSFFTPQEDNDINNYYSPVIDDLYLQPLDLIRIGKISDPYPNYYEVKKAYKNPKISYTVVSTSPSLDPSVSYINYQLVKLRSFPNIPTIRDCLKITPISFDPSTLTQIINNLNTLMTRLDREKTFKLIDGNARAATYLGKFYNKPISTTTTVDRITANYIIQNNTINTIDYFIPISENNQSIITNEYTNVFSDDGLSLQVLKTMQNNKNELIVDIQPNCNLSIDNLSTNFAILRPKPDETSVIVDHYKKLGDVSQAILIPQDASDSLKNAVGDIFSSLNSQLTDNQP